jgi:Arc/MetJ family transcription regulator
MAAAPASGSSPSIVTCRSARSYDRLKKEMDVDEDYLAAAQQVLHTQTKKETVNAALREVAALAARRRDLQRLTSGGLPDLADEQVMRAAWQR